MDNQGLKDDILTKALELFADVGFKQTSINKIVHSLGVSKGAFYHYFASKDDLIQQLVSRYVDSVVNYPEEIVNNPNLNALEKLNQLIHAFIDYKSEKTVLRERYKKLAAVSDNYELRERVYIDVISRAKEPYVKIFKQGMAEGIFDIKYPEQTAEVWLTTVVKFNTKVSKALEQKNIIANFDERVKFMEDLLERLLGIEEGSIKYEAAYRDYVKGMGGILQ